MEHASLVGYFAVHDGSGREVIIGGEKPSFVIGQDARCDLPLHDPAAESAHAVVAFRNGDYYIRPRYSSTTVLVNDRPIKDGTRLTPGAEVQIGSTLLTFNAKERAETAMVVARAVKPAVIPKYAERTAPVLAAQPIRNMTLVAATAGERTIYFPEVRKEPSAAPILAGYLSVIGVIGLFIHILLTQVAAASAVANPYAMYADGTVQVWVFHADW